jgi:paraquat-inducible protein A
MLAAIQLPPHALGVAGDLPITSATLASKDLLVACHDCDALYHLPDLAEGQAACCARCDSRLLVNRRNALHRSTAFTMAATTLLVLANVFPFMSIRAAGQQNVIVLAESSVALWEHGMPWLAMVVGTFIVATPVAMCLGLLYVLLPLLLGKSLPGNRWVCRTIYRSGPWNMMEVFFIGILVSLLKLFSISEVIFGVAFWAFGMLILCLTAALAAIDRRELWLLIERSRSL